MTNFVSTFSLVTFDGLLVILSIGATIFVMSNWAKIQQAGAAPGVGLILVGLWISAASHILDILYVFFLAGSDAVGPETQVFFTPVLHIDGLAFLFIVSGFITLMRKMLFHFAEQSKLLAETQQRESQLNDAAKLAKLGFCIYDTASERVIYCTEQHAAAHGVSVEDYLQKASSLANEFPLMHPDDRSMARAKYLQVRDGAQVEMEYRVPTPDGVRWVREVTSPVFDRQGRVVREIGTTQDITEERRTEQGLQQSIKMEAIGNLTGGVAHDFNNLLAVILGNLELAKESPEHSVELLDEAISATLRGADLTKSLLSFARRAPLEPVVMDINKTVRETKAWATRVLPSTVAIETSLLAGLWAVKADRSSTESVLLNLILNARDAMPEGGKIRIDTANVRVSADDLHISAEEIAPGCYVMLSIQDTGCGIDPEIMDRIFDPFFSTKGPGEGSGLGLSMIQGFMKQSGGNILVFSEPGEGTMFKLYFRAVTQEAMSPADATPQVADTAQDAKHTVLVAEDEPGVMAVLVRVLKTAGYGVISAETGDKALALFQSAERVDAILTDVVMPGRLQGPALVTELRALQPGLPAVLMSGYSSEAMEQGNDLRNGGIRLMKPVTRRDLLQAIEQALSDRP